MSTAPANDFTAAINQAWSDHVEQSPAVADRLPSILEYATTPADVSSWCSLAIHVMGEHLGRWDAGVKLLQQVGTHSLCAGDTDFQSLVRRGIATLQFAGGKTSAAWTTLGGNDAGASDSIRMLAAAASAMAGQNNTASAAAAFTDASNRASQTLAATDPAHRALAVTGNNLAVTFEEKPMLTTDEKTLMLKAAETARLCWEKAGTWLNIERAEYRLALSHLKAGNIDKAAHHAQLCQKICADNEAAPFEMVFVHECLARVHLASGRNADAQAALAEARRQVPHVDAADQEYCNSALDKVMPGV